jgi:hypothetical protein
MNKLARALMALFFFCVLFCAAGSIARATTITIPSQTVPNFQARSSGPVFLRIFLNRAFIANNGTGVAGTPLQPSSPSSNNYYLQLTCSLAGTTLTIPSFTIDSTTDGLDINTATYSAYFFDSTGAQIGVYAGFEQFRVPFPVVSASGCSPAGTCATWADLRAYNFARVQAPDNSAYTKSETLALINANIAGQVPITSPFWLKTPVAGLTNSVALSTLGTGLVKNTTGTGQPSIAAGDVDYQRPIAVTAPLTFAADSVGLPSGNLSVGPNLSISAGSGTGAVIGGGLTLSLGPSVVTQVANDTNIQGAISNGILTFAWGGTLAKNRNLASAVYTDQSNTFGNFVQSFQAGANFLLSDPASLTKQAQFILSNITAGQVRQISFPDSNSTTVVASAAPANQFATAISAQGVVSYAPAVVASSAPANQFATTISAAGALSYAQPAFSNLSGTATKGQVPATAVYTDQANTFGNFLQKLQAGANLSLVDPADTTKTAQFGLSNITTGQTRTVSIPDSNSTAVVASTAPANQFATGISGQGVVSYAAALAASTAPAHQFATAISAAGALSYAQPGFADVSGVATKAQAPATAVYTDQANSWSVGAQDFSAAGSVKVPTGAGLAPTASGLVGYDSTANDFVGGVNGATKVFADTSSAQTFTNKTLTQPAIADFTNAAHNHSTAAGGGQLTLGAFSSTTGSGAVVGATSPALVTPVLGVASATTINKYTFTQPATGATLTIADGKTVTFSNTFTFNGTDGGTHTFPNNSGTVAELNLAQIWTANQTHQNNGIGTALTDALVLNNTTAATAGPTHQDSPALHFSGNLWDYSTSPATGASVAMDTRLQQQAVAYPNQASTVQSVSGIGISPIQITTSSLHNLNTGDRVVVSGVGGNTNANGTFFVRVVSNTVFNLVTSLSGNGNYTSGGTATRASLGFLAFDPAINGSYAVQGGVWRSADSSFPGGVFLGSAAPTEFVAPLQLTGSFYQTAGAGSATYHTFFGQGAGIPFYGVDNYIGVTSTETNAFGGGNDYLGHFALAVSLTPTSSSVTNANTFAAGYFETRTAAQNQLIWGLNPLVQVNHTINSGAATGIEVDVNTSGLTANAPDPPSGGGGIGQVLGETITGILPSGKAGSAALLIGGNWKHGVYITGVGQASPSSGKLPTLIMAGDPSNANVGYGLDFQGTSFLATGAAIRIPNGVSIVGRNQLNTADVPLMAIDTGGYLRLVPNTAGGVNQGAAGYITGGGWFTSQLNGFFQVENSDGGSTVLNLASMGSIAFSGVQSAINFLRGRGGSASPAAIQAADIIGQIQFRGEDDTGISGAAAFVRGIVGANNWLSTDHNTILTFGTTPLGSNSVAEAMRIDGSGNLLIGTTTPTEQLTVNKNIAFGHLRGGTGPPAISAGPGAGTGGTVSISGTDAGGILTVNTGASPTANAIVAQVTFAVNYTATPKSIVLFPANSSAATLTGSTQVWIDASATTVSIFNLMSNATSGLPASSTFKWSYVVIQ